MRKNNFPTEVLEVEISHITPKGQGVAYYRHPAVAEGKLGKQLRLYINDVVPGDVVRVTVPNAKGRRRASVRFDELIKAGPTRNLEVEIEKEHAGGTPLKQMLYEGQLEYKENLVKQYFAEEGFDTDLVQPIIGMENPDRYRNKMDFTFGPDFELGLNEQNNYKKIIDIQDSIIAPKVMIEIKEAVSRWQKAFKLPGYNKDTREGLLRNLLIRQAPATREILVGIYATEAPEKHSAAVTELVAILMKEFPNIESFLWIVNTNIAEVSYDHKVHVLHGRDYINDKLNGFHYRIGYNTFFQASSVQAEKMVQCALEMAEVDETKRVLDLFCGIGTFSLPFAQAAKELVGIELVEDSIESAKENAELADLRNTRFFASDARKGLEELKATWETPDVLVLNPPRSGAGGKLMRSIGRYGSPNIVYISCNPKTLADDLKWLRDFGYEVKTVQPIDQFPHTVHVESVVKLEKQD